MPAQRVCGSFDLAAAQAVAVVDGDVPEALELLRRRSLLEWDATAERFSLHDLVRAFAVVRLEDADTVRLRHTRYYVGVAAAARALYLTGGATTLKGLALFDQERPHIDAGWNWALAHAGDQDADELLHDFAVASLYIGDLRYDTRRERIPQWEARLAAARRRSDRQEEGNALGDLGLAYADVGDARTAITYHEQALGIHHERGNRRSEGITLGNLGSAYAALGDVQSTISFYEQSLAIAREIGDRHNEGAASWNLGLALEQQGNLTRAAELMERSLNYFREIGHSELKKRATLLAQLRQRLAGRPASGTVAGEEAASTMSDAGEAGS